MHFCGVYRRILALNLCCHSQPLFRVQWSVFLFLFLAVLGLHCSTCTIHCNIQTSLSTCGMWASLVVACGHSCPVGQLSGIYGSLTRDRTRVPCFGRQILNHWTTREVPQWSALNMVRVTQDSGSSLFSFFPIS